MEAGHEQEADPGAAFSSRQAAGERLAAALLAYRDSNPLVLGIPRGGVPVAAEVARLLDAELDVIVTRKLGVPSEPELAMGAVTADGGLYVDEYTVTAHEVTAEQLAAVIARESEEAKAREKRFRAMRPQRQIAGRTVIVVDDGLAMGATMRASLQALRALKPAHLVAAVPVGSRKTCEDLRNEADEVICLHTPELLLAVGVHYDDFKAPSDETVLQILQALANGESPPSAGPPS
jgi:putative phosphoribosyl transferase